MATIIVSDNNEPYIEAIQNFLDLMQGVDVKRIACVAIVDSEDCYDVTAYWKMGPFDLLAAAQSITADGIWKIVKARMEDEGYAFSATEDE